jgi:hypothetical protein
MDKISISIFIVCLLVGGLLLAFYVIMPREIKNSSTITEEVQILISAARENEKMKSEQYFTSVLLEAYTKGVRVVGDNWSFTPTNLCGGVEK